MAWQHEDAILPSVHYLASDSPHTTQSCYTPSTRSDCWDVVRPHQVQWCSGGPHYLIREALPGSFPQGMGPLLLQDYSSADEHNLVIHYTLHSGFIKKMIPRAACASQRPLFLIHT